MCGFKLSIRPILQLQNALKYLYNTCNVTSHQCKIRSNLMYNSVILANNREGLKHIMTVSALRLRVKNLTALFSEARYPLGKPQAYQATVRSTVHVTQS